MKTIKKLSVLSLFGLLLATGCASDTTINDLVEAKLEILDATNSEVPTNYYSSLSDSDLATASTFKTKLGTIISANAVKFSYNGVWEVLEAADASVNEGYVNCFYTGQELKVGTSGNRSYNREHTWPKSHGFPSEGDTPYTDAYHLRATLTSINSSRGNKDFGEVDHATASSDDYGNYWTETVFEPRDEVKGDVARILFYMETRYANVSPYNLKLISEDVSVPSDTDGRLAKLETLIKWNYDDPVSYDEINRSNIIYTYQKNRNPYVDHPEFVGAAYPNEYINNNVDSTKVNELKASINSLSDTYSADNKDSIIALNNTYLALNNNERLLVTNYAKLSKIFKEANKESNNVEGQTIIDFQNDTTVTDSYAKNQIATVDGKTYTLTQGGKFNGAVRLGGKNMTDALASKYGLADTVGAALEFSYTINSLKEISFDFLSVYSGISSIYILALEEGSSTYTILAQKEASTSTSTIKATLPTAKTVKIALVATGASARVDLANAKYTTE